MDRFTAKDVDRLAGVLSGFDRLVFRGTLRAWREKRCVAERAG